MSPVVFRLSQWQMTLFVFLVSLCVTPFVYDSSIFLAERTQAWIVIVPAIGVGLLGTGLALALLGRFRGESILEYAPRVLGPVGGRLYLLALGIVLFTGAPANLHVLTRVVAFTELPRVSDLYIAFLFLGVVAFGCYFGPEVIARMAEALAPAVALGLAVIFLAPLATAVPVRLLPLSGFHLRLYWPPAVSSSIGTVRGYLGLLVLGGRLDQARGMGRAAVLALCVAGVLLGLSLIEPILDLGSGFAEQFRYPVLGVAGTVSFRWLPFQRLTTVTVLVWQMVMYVVLAFYLWSGTHVLAAATGIGHWRWWVAPAALVAAYVGGMAMPVAVSGPALDFWNYAVVAVGVLGPGLLLAMDGRRAGTSG